MWRPLNCKAICVQLCNTHTVFTNAFSVKYWVMELKSCKRRKRNGKIKGNCNTICAKRSAKCIQIFLNHGTDGYSQDNSALDEVCILDKKVLTILVLHKVLMFKKCIQCAASKYCNWSVMFWVTFLHWRLNV